MASVSKRTWLHKGKEKSAWIVRFLDHKGTHKQKTFQTKKEADRYCHEIDADNYSGATPLVNEEITVSGVCEIFLRAQEDRMRDGRIGKNREYQLKNIVNKSIGPYIGKVKLTKLTSMDVEQFYTDMIRRQGLAPATARDRIQDLSLIARFAITRGFLRKDPTVDALKNLRGIAAPKIRVFKLEEVRAVMQALQMRPFRREGRGHLLIRIYVHLAASCGMRLGEINGLRLNSINLDAGTVKIANSLTQFNELKGPKTKAGNREVALTKELQTLLADWVTRFYIPNDDNLLFRTKNNTRIRNSDFHSVYWHPLLKRAGLDGGDRPHFHALRHFFASWLIKNGMPLPDVAAAMGHASINITLEIYAHSIESEEHHLDTLRRFGDRLLVEAAPPLLPPPEDARPSL